MIRLITVTRGSMRTAAFAAIWVGFTVFSAGWSTQAQAATATEQLQAFVKKTVGASGRFEQSASDGNPQGASAGTFAFSRPGKFRWHVTEPYPQLLVADGEQVFFHDVDLDQVTIRPMSGAFGATPAAILFGTGDLDENFVVTEDGERDGLQWLAALPKNKEAGFEMIRIGFDANLPAAMEVLDAFNRTTLFRFLNIEQNPAFDRSMFEFTVPEGADVIRP